MEITAAVLRTTGGAYELDQVHLAGPGPGEVAGRVVEPVLLPAPVAPPTIP